MTLLSPIALTVLGALLGLASLWRMRRSLLLASCLLIWLSLALMTPLIANALVYLIESRSEAQAGECEDIDAIVLLSGGLARAALGSEDYAALNPESLLRLFHLWQTGRPDLPLVIAGGGENVVAEASVMASLLLRLETNGAAMALVETDSRTTWESAQELAQKLPPPRRLAIATSALHLPRARAAFMEAGFSVCRWPLQRQYLAASGIGALTPQTSALRKTEAVLHESVGYAYYRWLAWRASNKSE